MLRDKYLPKLHWFLRFLLVVLTLGSVWVFVAFVVPMIVPTSYVSNTSKMGFILNNERWSGEIRIVGDIWALPGTTVYVEPGTKILVEDHGDKFNLHYLPWELKSGLNTDVTKFGIRNGELFKDERQKISMHFATLFALGTEEQPIIIKSLVPYPPSHYDFNTFSLNRGMLSFVKMSNYRRLEVGDKVVVQDSEFKDVGECAVCLKYASPTISNNVFEHALREYIWVYGGRPKISDNLFMASSGKGIVVDPQIYGAPIIEHNDFEMPTQVALEFLNGGEEQGAIVSANNFAGASIIIIPCDTQAKFAQNQIKGIIRLTNEGSCIGSISFGPNYWSTQDIQAIIKEKIEGRPTNLRIIIPYVLSSPPQGVGRRTF